MADLIKWTTDGSTYKLKTVFNETDHHRIPRRNNTPEDPLIDCYIVGLLE